MCREVSFTLESVSSPRGFPSKTSSVACVWWGRRCIGGEKRLISHNNIITNSYIDAFSTATVLRKADFFKMPAMSPTMEKGGVTSWKFKEGDSFNAGDVLLEVETDKSTIDVEAQDDGILAKIIHQDGAKDLAVGTPIAVIAEPGDDLATLEMPKDSNSSAPSAAAKTEAPKKEAPKKEAPKPEASKKETPKSPSVESGKADPKQTFFPSVASLLSENNISRDVAIEKIPATGPQGRLVKGDVLAYLGKISQESVNSITSFVNSHSKLDLSNIEKLAIKPKEKAPEAADDAKAKAQQPKKAAAPEPITKAFSLDAVLALRDQAPELGIKSFSVREYVEGASQRAERYAYQLHAKKSDYYDPIFEELVAPSKGLVRFSIKLDIPSSATSQPVKKTDPLDFVDELLSAPVSQAAASDLKVTVTLNSKAPDAKEKAGIYLQKLEEYLQIEN
ncbi:CYFA0S19e01464g1_1 [Cyberlindnera fabianii]|uniref:CYFA0S19e01464g1_1 n=1 Tax=Cyberlindnera fabianii TaxID=36022 RepID=A0A061BCR1_CYBFA|nr:CYFA0S19e01464g1_1 [Cyberlindnera fabianii]